MAALGPQGQHSGRCRAGPPAAVRGSFGPRMDMPTNLFSDVATDAFHDFFPSANLDIRFFHLAPWTIRPERRF